jgi:outer membrane receptor protein involved in Fe transport
VEVERDSLESAYADPQRATRRMGAAFLTGEWRVTDAIRLAAGARWDSIGDEFEGLDVSDDAFSPRAGVSADLGRVTAYLQLSRAFKAPTLDQRFDQRPLPDFSGGTFTISNPALEAQRSRNVEIGVRGTAWELVAYDSRVEDEIDFDIRTFRYANIGESTHRGIEARTQWTAGARRFALTYAWTRAQSEGRQLKNIAEHVARADVDLRAFVDVHLAIEHSADRWLDDDNLFALDDATVVDLRIARSFASITAAIDATNLFNRHNAPLGYALGDVPYYYPAAGRSVAMTLQWRALP